MTKVFYFLRRPDGSYPKVDLKVYHDATDAFFGREDFRDPNDPVRLFRKARFDAIWGNVGKVDPRMLPFFFENEEGWTRPFDHMFFDLIEYVQAKSPIVTLPVLRRLFRDEELAAKFLIAAATRGIWIQRDLDAEAA